MNLICLDFDGVLFDDRRFKKEYELLFRRTGISRDVYEKTYQESKKKGYYDPRVHIRLALGFASHESGIQKNLYARVTKFLNQSARFIYPDVFDFLGFLRRENIGVMLLSTGDSGFQQQKISKSGIGDLCDDVVIISGSSKVRAIDLIMRREKPEHIIFIDDKKDVVEEIKKSLPSIYVIQMLRNDTEKPANNTDLCVNNFSQTIEFIKKWQHYGIDHTG